MFRRKRLTILITFFMMPLIMLSGHPKDVTQMTVSIDETSINGELFIHGYQVARLAQQYNLNPSQLSLDDLKNLLRSYFDYHFLIEGRHGNIYKTIIDFQNSDPAEFLATGITLIFYAELAKGASPLVFYSDFFFEFSKTQTNKIIFRDKSGKPLPGAREVILAQKRREFTLDLFKPDFSFYDFDLSDSDGDGIADQYEELYGLNPQNADTDGDGFSDFEEFFCGWDPFDKNLAQDQTKEKLENEVKTFAELYRQKPTIKSALLSLPQLSELKDTAVLEVSPTVERAMLINAIGPEESAENGYLQTLLRKMEAELFSTFDFGNFLILLGLLAALAFFHAGSSGAGKGILIAFSIREGRGPRQTLYFSVAFTATQLLTAGIGAIILWAVSPYFFQSLSSVLYYIQLGAGIVLAGTALTLIVMAVRKIKAKIVIGKKTFFDTLAASILFGAATGLGACPFLWAILRLLVEIDRGVLVPFFFLVFGVAVFACMMLVALATLVIRHIFLDIIPRLSFYAELVSACLMFVFAVFFVFPNIPF